MLSSKEGTNNGQEYFEALVLSCDVLEEAIKDIGEHVGGKGYIMASENLQAQIEALESLLEGDNFYEVDVWTDGSAGGKITKGRTQVGGWASLVNIYRLKDGLREVESIGITLKGGSTNAQASTMELQAIFESLQYLIRYFDSLMVPLANVAVHIRSDAKILVDQVHRSFQVPEDKSDKFGSNADRGLWLHTKEVISKFSRQMFRIQWIRRNSQSENIYCDLIAGQEMERRQLIRRYGLNYIKLA